MKARVYLDTSVVSARFDGRTPERMAQTETAWGRFVEYDPVISETVLEELGAASPPLREKLLDCVAGFTTLSVTEEAKELANAYVAQGIFPEKYFDDALHVAIASVHQVGILLSWNFVHLVKLKTRRMVGLANMLRNHSSVEIISPPEL